jgi:diguanylate cyclase (GGDEF)-like protein
MTRSRDTDVASADTPVTPEQPALRPLRPTLTVLKGPGVGSVHRPHGTSLVIGRDEGLPVTILADGVSRRHAELELRGTTWWLKDLGSKNGTMCRGARVTEPVELADGDRVALGSAVVLRFALEDQADESVRTQLYQLATRDPLTRAHSRRFFEERLAQEWPFCVRHAVPCTLLWVDVDLFRAVNTEYGPSAGDAVLQHVASVIREVVREEDLVGRVGGEEFAVLCREIPLTHCQALAERLRDRVQDQPLSWHGLPIDVTVSIGIATSAEGDVASPEELIERAQRRLSAAQERGASSVEPASH